MTARLPWPPSVNAYWRHGPRGTYLNKRGREFRTEAVRLLAGLGKVAGPVKVALEMTAPDKRRRDLDNHVKGVLDALTHAGAIEDDSLVVELLVRWVGVEPPGCCDVTVEAA